MFKNIILSALIVGAIAGAILGAMQLFTTSPIILAAEFYEVTADAEPGHDDSTAAHGHSHGDDAEAWSPEDGFERTISTIVASILTAVGFAMLTIAAMAYSQKTNLLHGLLFGIAGYLSFYVAPSMGLLPEIPGSLAANLEGRQGWWMMTVILTAAGLACLAFIPSLFRLFGIALIAIPHIIGAPQPEHHGFLNQHPDAVKALTELSNEFILMTGITLFIFWVILGLLASAATKRFV